MAKKRTPEELARIKARKEFVQSNPELDPAEARKRYYVQTRVQELEKSGVEVTKERRAALRQKFLSGGVQRQGFYTPADLAKFTGGNKNNNTNNGGGNWVGPPVPQTGGYMNPTRGKDVPGFKPGQVQKSTKKTPGYFEKGGAFDKYMEKNVAGPIDRAGAATKKFRNKKGYIPVISDIAWVGEQGTKFVKDTGSSLAATFTNPSINAVAGLFGKKPNLREAGALEATINTVGTVIDIGTAGGSKPLTSALSKAALKGSQSLLKKNAVGAATALSNVARKSKAAIEAAEQARMFPRVSGLEQLTSPTTKTSNKTKAPGEIGGVKFVKTKSQPEFVSGGLDGTPTFKNPTGTKTPRRKKVTTTETPGGPAVSTKTGKPVKARKPRTPKAQTAEPYVAPQTQGTPNAALQAQLQAQADEVIETGLSKVTKKAATKKKAPTKKASTKKKTTAYVDEQGRPMSNLGVPGQGGNPPFRQSAPQSSGGKTIEWVRGSTTQAPVPQSLADIKTTTKKPAVRRVTSTTPAPVAPSSTRPAFRTIFTDQKDFDSFMAAGGEGVVKSQTLGVQDTFIRKNQQFIAKNKQASAQRAMAAKINAAKQKAEVTAINEANGFVRTIVPKSQQALRQPVKKAAPAKKAAAKKAAPAKKAAKKSTKKAGSKQPTALANLLSGRG
ncbi:hypothetical protein uvFWCGRAMDCOMC493_06 [Freshwater phage uvFW-CGR-AMD-COM-C493]|nr:hypothetical protein uvFWCGRAMDCOMC493_06 [Freshwater phage uvFW-CGR-AMD-COM-C493]